MPFFDRTLISEQYDASALVGLCDVTINGETYKNERIRLDLDEGVIRIEAAKFCYSKVPVGRTKSEEFVVSNISIHSRGAHLTLEKLDYSFVCSVGGGSLNVANTALTNVTGFYSRPATIKLICNNHIEFEVDLEFYERRFFVGFDFHKINLSPNIELIGSKQGFSVIGEEVFQIPNVDNALAIVTGTRVGWSAEWEAKKLRIRTNSYKKIPLKARPIISTGQEFVSLEETCNNTEVLFPLALKWLNGLEAQQLTKALGAINSLLTARMHGQDYLLGMFGVFKFWEWACKSRTLSKVPLAKCLDVTLDEADALLGLRNDLIHDREFFLEAIKTCDLKLKKHSSRYLDDFDMQKKSATVMNYVHSLSAEALMKIIGYEGETQKYFPISGSRRNFTDVPATPLLYSDITKKLN